MRKTQPLRSTIFYIELGVYEEHEEFRDRLGPVEWLYTKRTVSRGQNTRTQAPVDIKSHSTCVASKIAGMRYGASKISRLIVVKLPDFSTESILEAIPIVTDHIRATGRRRAVINISWSSKVLVDSNNLSGVWDDVREHLQELQKIDESRCYLHIVCAAGNHAQELSRTGDKRLRVDTAPAIFGTPQEHGNPPSVSMIIVENCDNDGRRSPKSQVSRLDQQGEPFPIAICAPGVSIECATTSSQSATRIASGTSFCKSIQDLPSQCLLYHDWY